MNIAEGSSKNSKKERAKFYEIAFASLEELHYQFLLSYELKYISQKEFELAEEKIGKASYLIYKLRKSCL